jgi:hypothetical protein
MDPTFFRAIEENYTSILFETLEARRSVDTEHSYIASVEGSQGSGKSYASIALCAFLDPNFGPDNIYFDYNKLVYDRRKLRPHTAILVDEQTESYGIDSHRVNIILKALKEQLRKKSIHFFFCSPTLKAEHECLVEDAVVSVKDKGYIKVKDVQKNNFLYGSKGTPVKVINKVFTTKPCYEIKTDFGGKVIASNNHRFKCSSGLKKVDSIRKGDLIELSCPRLKNGTNRDFYKGFFYGAYLADGSINDNQLYRTSKYTGKRVKTGRSYFLRISNTDRLIKKTLYDIGKRFFDFTSIKISSKKIDFYGKKQVVTLRNLLGKNLKSKIMLSFDNKAEALGILNGFASCDSGWSISKNANKDKLRVGFTMSNDSIAMGLADILHCFGIYPTINRWLQGDYMPLTRLYIPSLQVEDFFSLLKYIKNDWKKRSLNHILKVSSRKKYGKAYVSSCKRLNMLKDKLYGKVLSIKKVGKRKCIDFEVDSDDHLFQLGGGLLTHNSSMYIFETLFIDHAEKVCFAAYKTRELLTLGYVAVPHPLNFVTKDFLKEYERRKDMHLDQLTGRVQVDEVEEAAKQVVHHPLFVSAEKLYKKTRGYVPTNMLVQLINKIFPEFKSNVMAVEISQRIKLNKEMTGEWTITGIRKKKG